MRPLRSFFWVAKSEHLVRSTLPDLINFLAAGPGICDCDSNLPAAAGIHLSLSLSLGSALAAQMNVSTVAPIWHLIPTWYEGPGSNSQKGAAMAGYVLYGYPCSGSAAIEVAMTYAGIPFEFRDVEQGTSAVGSEEFRAINPRQQVPALVHPDGSVITEVPAILNHLADAHPKTRLAPQPGTSLRAQHDRWLAFLHANVYEGLLRVLYSERYTENPSDAESVRVSADTYVTRHLQIFDEAIGDGPFFFGEQPSGVDFLAWVLTTWMNPLQVTAASPKVAHLAEEMRARAEISEAVARNI